MSYHQLPLPPEKAAVLLVVKHSKHHQEACWHSCEADNYADVMCSSDLWHLWMLTGCEMGIDKQHHDKQSV